LPPRQRLWGMVLGAGFAVVLRIALITVVAELMLLPYLKLTGGVALLYIAAKLLVPERSDRDDVEAVAHLWRAVRLVATADIVMSLDNVIAIAAIAQGNITLLVIGLVLAVPIIIAGAALIMALLDRFPILIWGGAGLLGWIAGGVIATDPAVAAYSSGAFGEEFADELALATSAAGALLVVIAGGLWRRRRFAEIAASGDKPMDAP
jgi:YjbE family integral membrane protein